MSTPQAVNRREFVRGGSAAALAVALEAKAASKSEAAGEWRNRNPDMAYLRLGRTNYMVSEIVCG